MNESSGDVTGPKFIVPRQIRLTRRPVRPRCAYSMGTSGGIDRVSTLTQEEGYVARPSPSVAAGAGRPRTLADRRGGSSAGQSSGLIIRQVVGSIPTRPTDPVYCYG